jgi:selT/selW/selH-like putative selenoprotein
VVPGANGIFDVHVNGELVFTKSMLGRYPQPDEVVPLLRDHLAVA